MTAEEAAADPTVEILSIDPEDAAFILGKGGSTKKKVARAAGVKLELDSSALDAAAANNANGGDAGANSAPSPSHALYIKDKSEAKRRRAREYVGFVLQQRRGKIEVDFPSDGKPRDDLSIVEVPDDGCKAYITGKNGSVLRMMEEEWGTLMFFGRARDAKGELGEDALMVLGTRRARRGAELKVMSAVEHKVPGTFVDAATKTLREKLSQPGDDENDGFRYDVFPFERDEISYALGAQVRAAPVRSLSVAFPSLRGRSLRSARSLFFFRSAHRVDPPRLTNAAAFDHSSSRVANIEIWSADVFWLTLAG